MVLALRIFSGEHCLTVLAVVAEVVAADSAVDLVVDSADLAAVTLVVAVPRDVGNNFAK